MQRYYIHNWTIEEFLEQYKGEPFTAVLSDPPYGLDFMGKEWDHGVPGEIIWHGIYHNLKPGASLMAFGGSRTFHRLMVNIEDSGFIIRDVLMYLYSGGFPKSNDIGKSIDRHLGHHRKPTLIDNQYVQPDPVSEEAALWDGYGTTLKPAYEPVAWAMRPKDGSYVNNALTHGVAGLNIDGNRVGNEDTRAMKSGAKNSFPHNDDSWMPKAIMVGSEHGRWPANVIHDGSDEVEQMFSEYGTSSSKSGGITGLQKQYVGGKYVPYEVERTGYDDKGTISRFFYCAKAQQKERDAGVINGTNDHVAVKPLALCVHLAKLMLPPKSDKPRRILVPFSGSGSEMIGALLAGWDEIVGVEKDSHFVNVAYQRLTWWENRYNILRTDDIPALLNYSDSGQESLFEKMGL